MEKFGLSGLWKHIGSSVVAAGLGIADPVLSYLNVIALPTWAHWIVGVAVLALASYKGQAAAAVKAAP